MVNVHERLRLASPMWSRYPSESSDATTTASSSAQDDDHDSYAGMMPRQLRYSWSSRESNAPLPPYDHRGRGSGAGFLAATSSTSQSSGASTRSTANSSSGGGGSNNERSVRAMLDGFIASTFLSCVQQPIDSCVSGDASRDWDYRYEGGSSSFRRAPVSTRHAPPPRRARSDASSTSSFAPAAGAISPSSDEDAVCALEASPLATECSYDCRATTTSQQVVVAVKTPGENDVVCGKGGSRVRHPGNERFRELCRANRPTYATLTKKQKIVMAKQIVHMVRGTRPPGHFLARNPHTGLWEDVGLERSLEKAAQALRDRAASSNHSECPEDPEERQTHDMPASPVRSTVSSSAVASFSVRTPKSSSGRTAPPQLPMIQIPLHLRTVFRPVDEEPPRLSSLRTPVLADPTPQARATAMKHHHYHHHHHDPQPYVSPAAAYHRYPSFRGDDAPDEPMITPEGREDRGFRSHEAMVAHVRHSWQAVPPPPPALPDAPDDELMFSPGPILPSTRQPEPTKLLVDPDGGWTQYPPPRHHHLLQHQHQHRGCEPDDEFPDDEDMAAPSLVSMSTVTQASSSLVSTSWSARDYRSHDDPLDVDDDDDDDEGRLRRRPLPLFSPSGLLQSRGHHFQSRGTRPLTAPSDYSSSTYVPHDLPQPSATIGCGGVGGGGEYDSDTSMDGGTALSTALFLRLDESEE